MQPPALETRSGQPLTQEQVEQLFQAWLRNAGNLSKTSREAGVSKDTVARYRDAGGWEDRARAVIEKAQERVDMKLVEEHARTLLVLKAFKSKLARRVSDMLPTEIHAGALAGELEKLARCEALLLGGATERLEVRSYENMIRDLRLAEAEATPDLPVDPDTSFAPEDGGP